MAWNGTNPFVVGNATKKQDLDRVFDNLLLLKTSISDNGLAWSGSASAANLTGSHTLPDGVLSTNVPLLSAASNTFANTLIVGGTFAGLAGGSIVGAFSAAVLIPTSAASPGDGMALLATHGLQFWANGGKVLALYQSGGAYLGVTPSDPTAGCLTVEGSILAGATVTAATVSTTNYQMNGTFLWNGPPTGTGDAVNLQNVGGPIYSMVRVTSSRRYKEHIVPWSVDAEGLKAFLDLAPAIWDYIGGEQGAASFISEDLHDLPIRNAYGRSPFVNYADGLPNSNRDFSIIAMQHLVARNHEARIAALEEKYGHGR